MKSSYKLCVQCFVVLVLGIKLVSCYPWNQTPSPPVCVSHNALCDVTFEITGKNALPPDAQHPQTSSQICQCPGDQVCPITVDDPFRVVHLLTTTSEQTIKTRLSYCNALAKSNRPCRHEEVAVTLRGVGPIALDVVGDVACSCPVPLTLKRARPDGLFSLREFACGKKECRMNESIPPVCERVKSTRGFVPEDIAVETEFPCECPSGYDCSIKSHVARKNVTEYTCKLNKPF